MVPESVIRAPNRSRCVNPVKSAKEDILKFIKQEYSVLLYLTNAPKEFMNVPILYYYTIKTVESVTKWKE